MNYNFGLEDENGCGCLWRNNYYVHDWWLHHIEDRYGYIPDIGESYPIDDDDLREFGQACMDVMYGNRPAEDVFWGEWWYDADGYGRLMDSLPTVLADTVHMCTAHKRGEFKQLYYWAG